MSVQRYNVGPDYGTEATPAPAGWWVRWDDHERAVAEAVAAEREAWITHCNRVELREREACAQAVEALLSQREGVEAGYRQVIAAAIRARGQA